MAQVTRDIIQLKKSETGEVFYPETHANAVIGLGTAATTDSSAYATSTQGSHADDAYNLVKGNKTANTVLAAPNGAAGAASFRALVAADIPSLTKSKISDFPTTWALANITGADDLKAIEALEGTSGVLKKTAANTWALDTNIATYASNGNTAYGYFTNGVLKSANLPLAANGTRGGIQIGYSENGNNYAVKLSSEKAYVSVPWVDTKNTAGSTNTTDKIYLVGASTQAANPQTYSNANVYTQNGIVYASKFIGPLETSYDDTVNNLSMYKAFGGPKKVYTGLCGVANGTSPNNNSYANQSFYFITVHPKTWDSQWSVKYRLNIHLDNESQTYKSSSTASTVSAGLYMKGTYDCNINGTGGTYNTFHFFQSQKNTSYRPIYYHMIHETTSAGYAAGYGHKIGVSFVSAYLPTPVTDYSSGSAVSNTKYPRTIEVIIEEAVNCDVELVDTPEVEGDAYRSDYTKLNTTYYPTNTSSSNSAGGWINLSATTQGLYESGDNDTYGYTQQTNNYLKNATKNGTTDLRIFGYNLIGFNKNGNALGISVYSSSQTSNTTSVSAKGTRLYCTEGFDYTKGIRYTNSSSVFSANGDMNISTAIDYTAVDLRYSDNNVASSGAANTLGMVVRKPVYLRGTIGSDGLFYLAPIDVTYNNGTYQRAWVQDIPTVENENGEYVYWFIGYPYYNGSYPNSLYQLDLITQSELVWYKNGTIRSYTEASKLSDNSAYTAWGQTFFNNGVPQSVSGAISNATTGSFSSNVSVGGTLSVSNNTTLSSNVYLGTSGTAHTGWANGQYLQWDNTNKAWHLIGNFYADGFVSAGGLSNASGTSGIDEQALWNLLDATNEVIGVAHIPNITVSKVSDIETWITNKGFVTSSGITSVTKGSDTTGGAVSTSGDSVIIQFPTAYSLPVAKYNTLGGVKPAYTSTNAVTLTTAAASNTTTPTIAAKTTTSGRYYAIEADKNGVLFVNVPWENNTYTVGTGIFSISANGGTAVHTLFNANSTVATIGLNFANGNYTTASVTAASGSTPAKVVINHNTSGVTSGSYGDSAAQTPAYGGTFKVPYVTVDTYGHVTGISEHTVKIPASDNTDTKNTAGSTDTSSKIFLIGATTQAANPQTYSDDEVYVTSGVLTTKSVQVGGTAATIQYNATDQSIEFIFA